MPLQTLPSLSFLFTLVQCKAMQEAKPLLSTSKCNKPQCAKLSLCLHIKEIKQFYGDLLFLFTRLRISFKGKGIIVSLSYRHLFSLAFLIKFNILPLQDLTFNFLFVSICNTYFFRPQFFFFFQVHRCTKCSPTRPHAFYIADHSLQSEDPVSVLLFGLLVSLHHCKLFWRATLNSVFWQNS